MAIFFNITTLPAFKNAVVTIGTFDGVHLGHRCILQEVVSQAKTINGESVLITFDPHPRKLIFPDQELKLLTPLPTKLELVTDAGIDHVVVVPFTRDFANLSAEDYISQFLVQYFKPHTIIIGHDHQFGHDRKGGIDLLQQLSKQYDYQVVEIPAQLIDEAAVSSTKIRKAITAGHVQDAAHMLGRYYTLTGKVIKGRQLGRTIGYPTANITPNDPAQVVPAIGIYAVTVQVASGTFNGMLSIGYNPTVTDEQKINIEVNIFDFDQDIYGQELELSFVTYLRNEEKFASLEALKEQLAKDKENTLAILKIAQVL
ncbi:MAG: bifunctional riboflavin kinase/FAD synthetase [Flavipsychrobacter sp.]|nr:bifunctional riboflavin kinase/FAD synthetase [Flavipsychrobacter sp.]